MFFRFIVMAGFYSHSDRVNLASSSPSKWWIEYQDFVRQFRLETIRLETFLGNLMFWFLNFFIIKWWHNAPYCLNFSYDFNSEIILIYKISQFCLIF